MDIVDLEEMGLIDSSADLISAIPDSSQIIYTQDNTINISSDELTSYGSTVTLVTLPNLVQILQHGGTEENVGYLINSNQIPELGQSVVISQDNITETNVSPSTTQFCADELLQNFSPEFLSSSSILVTSGNEERISGINKSANNITTNEIIANEIQHIQEQHCITEIVSSAIKEHNVGALCSIISPITELQSDNRFCPTKTITLITDQEDVNLVPSNQRVSKTDDKHEVDPPDKTGSVYCEECKLQFPSSKHLRKHKWEHMQDKPYKCSFCHESFNYEMNLNLHLATHNSGKPYCPVCKKHFNRIASLKAHIMFHEREESVFCNICGDEFNSHISLEGHLKEHSQNNLSSEKRMFKCNFCVLKFGNFKERKSHLIKVHKVSRNRMKKKVQKRGNQKCDVCPKTFEKPSQLLRHKRIHTGERPYKCEICSRGFSQNGSLRIHMHKHTSEKPYICRYCNGMFSQKGNLQAHIKRLHLPPEEDERIYKCHVCTCLFRKLGSLNAHFTKLHSACAPAEGVTNNEKNKLSSDNHQTVDSSSDSSNKENKKQLLCESIQKDDRSPYLHVTAYQKDGTVEKNKVAQHKIKSLSCTYCSKEFRRPGDLVRHVRTHTNEKPFKCNECCKSFSLQTTLSMHLDTHRGGKKFACSKCNKCYSTIRSLKIHAKKHVSDEMAQDQNETEGELLEPQLKKTQNEDNYTNLVSLNQADLSSFNSNIILTENGNIVDMNSDIEEDESREGYVYKCSECNMLFKKVIHLTIHMKTHKQAFNCELCTRTFDFENDLDAHIKQCHQPKTYSCKECDLRFPNEISYMEHKESHSSNFHFPWTCPICGTTFKSYLSCKEHITSIHSKMDLEKIRPVLLLIKQPVKQKKEKPKQQVTSFEPIKTNENESIEIHTDLQDFISNIQPNQLYLTTVQGNDTNYSEYGENNIVINSAPITGNMQKQLLDNSLDSCIFTFQPPVDVNSPTMSMDVAAILPQPGTLNSDLVNFSLHKANHFLTKLHTCITCDDSFASAVEYEEHLKLHLQDPERSKALDTIVTQDITNSSIQVENCLFRCSECSLNFITLSDLTNHQEVAHNSSIKNYSSNLCNESLDSCIDLKIHELSHNQKVLKYTSSKEVFESKEEIRSLSQRYDLLANSIAEKKKSRSNWLPARRLTEEETKALFTIEPSNATISEKVLLQSLLEKERFEHPVKEILKPPEVHQHKCKYCPKSFRKQSDLIRHVRVHTGERPYQCFSCNKRFSIKTTASNHMKTHSKDKPFQCYICAKNFSTTGSLKIHMRLHTGLKPFACTLCDETFRTSGHKKAHLMKHLKASFDNSESNHKNKIKKLSKKDEINEFDLMPFTTRKANLSTQDSCSSNVEGSQFLVPLKQHNSSFQDLTYTKNSQFLTSLSLKDHDESNKTPKFLLNVNDEGEVNGDSPRYLLAIKDGGTGEDDFIVETISEEEIIVTITKGDSDISSQGNLAHEHINNLVENYSCTFCEKTFPKRILLDKHVKKSHQQEMFQCIVCLEMFERKSDLDLHILAHELDREFSCPECTESFSLEEELQAHKCSKTASLDLSLDHDLFLFAQV